MKDKFKLILVSAPDAIIIINAEGKIQLINAQTERLFGYTRNELIGKSIALLMPSRSKSKHQAHIKSFFEKPKTRAIVAAGAALFAQHKNGKEFRIEISINSLETAEVSLISAAIRDVTKQKLKEKELIIANRKLVFENEEKEKRAVEFDSVSEKLIIEHDLLIKAENQLRNYATQLTYAMEEDRARIAREIHDDLGQQLTAFKMGIDWVLHKQTNIEGEVAEKLNEMLKMSDTAVTSIRRISSDLRPAIIDDLGLIPALEGLCHDLKKTSGITCHFISTAKERKFDDNLSINTYRIVQETLTNVIRHSKAKSVTISITENGGKLIIEVSDDGIGISQETILASKHLGIMGMKERAALLGGKLTIEGIIGKGTRTKLILPFKNEYVNS